MERPDFKNLDKIAMRFSRSQNKRDLWKDRVDWKARIHAANPNFKNKLW